MQPFANGIKWIHHLLLLDTLSYSGHHSGIGSTMSQAAVLNRPCVRQLTHLAITDVNAEQVLLQWGATLTAALSVIALKNIQQQSPTPRPSPAWHRLTLQVDTGNPAPLLVLHATAQAVLHVTAQACNASCRAASSHSPTTHNTWL